MVQNAFYKDFLKFVLTIFFGRDVAHIFCVAIQVKCIILTGLGSHSEFTSNISALMPILYNIENKHNFEMF